jgi:CBS domain-containing protein
MGADLDTAHQIMLERGVSALAVVDPEGRMVGVLSMTDLIRAGRIHSADRARPALHLPRQAVERQMRREVISIHGTDDLALAAQRMVDHHVHRVFVVRDGRPCGVVSTMELAHALADARVTTPVRIRASAGIYTIEASHSLGGAVDRLADSGVRGLVVTDAGWPVGLFTQHEALQARERPASTHVEEAMSFALVCVPEQTPLWRAAGHAIASSARRVLTISPSHQAVGILSGLDFASAYLAEQSSPHARPMA